jgi:membrane-associated phospholipid phosphatase
VGGRAFRFLGLFLPCVLTGVAYDWFRLVVHLRGPIHVADLYHAELAWFGIAGQVPADWLLAYTHPLLDAICGLSYVLYLYVPMAMAIVLFFKDQRRMLLVGFAFFFTNLLGLILYLSYPAAPPWYVAIHGLGPVQLDALPSAAGAARFDALFGIQFFQNFYSRSANVFGAMPSLHVAYPMSTCLALVGMKRRWWLPVAVFVAVVSFAAIYLQHHYILDVIVGALCALVAFLLARAVMKRYDGLRVKRTMHA